MECTDRRKVKHGDIKHTNWLTIGCLAIWLIIINNYAIIISTVVSENLVYWMGSKFSFNCIKS